MPPDARFGFHPDDTSPIPRPSRYYGRRQDLVTLDRAQGRRNLEVRPSADASIVPASPGLFPAQIDKSVLAIAEPKRLPVASWPCTLAIFSTQHSAQAFISVNNGAPANQFKLAGVYDQIFAKT